jgi:glycosyltransferase involved in cell wall biosynthesis
MAETARKRGFDPQRILVAGYGVDLKAAGGLAVPNGTDYEGVFLGRFHEQKGLEDLLQIWREVRGRLPAARLGLIGDGKGPAATRFKSELSRQEDLSISQLGVLQGEQKYAALKRGRVFVFPSHHESWGHVVIEAMAAGMPVVGYDLPSSKEAFGSAMLMVPMGDALGFADAIVRLLLDADLYNTYRERGRKLAESYDWDRIAQKFASRLWE